MTIDLYQTIHHFTTGVYAKQMTLLKGHVAVSHQHNYDHLSILAMGTVVVRTTPEDARVHIGPCALNIKAGVNHEITALEDSVWFCIHATDETDLNHIDEVLIKHPERE